jgi:hypothetical protein
MDAYNASLASVSLRTLEATPASQRFEILDTNLAMCFETWPLKEEQRAVNRWTRLVKKELGWLVESVEEGVS